MDPLYKPGAKSHAVLRYGWIGWPAQGTAFPETMLSFVTVPSEDWERDGFRLLEHRFTPEEVRMTFSVKPQGRATASRGCRPCPTTFTSRSAAISSGRRRKLRWTSRTTSRMRWDNSAFGSPAITRERSENTT